MGPGHPECPERLDAIEDRLLVTGVGDALERFEAPEAALADIELAHDRMHVAALRAARLATALPAFCKALSAPASTSRLSARTTPAPA